MRLALLLLGTLVATAGLAAAEDFAIKPMGGDATGSVLALTTDGDAWCASTQCAALTMNGDAYCYGPYCLSFATDGTAACQALVCVAGSIFGDSYALGRPANTDANAVLALSVFGDATSARTRSDQNDYAISGTGDASSDSGFSISITGHAHSTRGFELSGCDTAAQLCVDPA